MQEWQYLPSSDLTKKENWLHLGQNRYAVLRSCVLIVKTRDKTQRPGPVVERHNIPADTEREYSWDDQIVISSQSTIEEKIHSSVSEKIIDKLVGEISSSISARGPGVSAGISSKLGAEASRELAKSFEHSVSQTHSYAFQMLRKKGLKITLKGSEETKTAEFRYLYWPINWGVYLYSTEYLEFEFKKGYFWRQIRNTIKKTPVTIQKDPLFRVTFFEPQREVDVFYEGVDGELENPDAILVEGLDVSCPNFYPPKVESLEYLAKLAFPVNRSEREAARTRTPRKAPVKKAAKRPAKRPTARKATKKRTRKSPKRKAAKKK